MTDLRQTVGDYLTMRRALGFSLEREGRWLMDFVGHLEQADSVHITTELAVAWATRTRTDVNPAHWNRRLEVVRVFARHQHTLDPATQIPPAELMPHRYRRVAPYLFTPEQINALIQAAASLPHPLRALNYTTLIALLAVTGMRVGEACGLDRSDVDSDHGVLTIRAGKLTKAREVPLHPTAAQALQSYDQRRDHLCRAARVPLDYSVAWPELRLCGMVVLIDHACNGRSSADGSQVVEFGRVPGRLDFDVRGPLPPGLVRPVMVVVDQILAEHQSQVALAEYQDPVQEFAAESPDHAFADGVHPRSLRQGGDDPQAVSFEHLPERGREERIAVMNQEPQRTDAVAQVHGQVPGLLYRPRPCRVRSHAARVQAPGAVLDEHQHVDPLEQHGLYHQEVTGDERVSLGGQKLPPGRPCPAGRGIDAGDVQDLPYRGRSDRVSQPGQLTLDPAMAPCWVLPRHPHDQRLDRDTGRRPSQLAPVGEAPFAGDQVTVPAQERGRGDREHVRPAATVNQTGQHRQPEPVGVIPPRPASRLTAQHLVLVTKHEQLDVLGQIRPDQHCQQAEQAPHHPVNET
jgi:hypothetical protein